MLITMLPNANIVEAVLLKDGWATALKKNDIAMDMSSSAPLRSRALCRILAKEGLGYLDAPVSGGIRRAVDDKLAILVGGDPALLATCRPVLEAMGSSILHIDEAGAGHTAKALNNFVSAMALWPPLRRSMSLSALVFHLI